MCYIVRIALKFDWLHDSDASAVPIKFQSNWMSLNINPGASIIYKISK